MKKLFFILVLFFAAVIAVGCNARKNAEQEAVSSAAKAPTEKPAIVTTKTAEPTITSEPLTIKSTKADEQAASATPEKKPASVAKAKRLTSTGPAVLPLLLFSLASVAAFRRVR